MKRKNKKDVSAEKTESSSEKKKGRKEGKTCNKCRWYDKSTERDFRRKVGPRNEKGERSEIVEVRAVCRNPKAKAFNRLVHATLLKRECPHWEKGIYKAPEKPEKKKKSKRSKRSKKTTKDDSENSVTSTNKLNGETKTFEKKGRKLVVKEDSEQRSVMRGWTFRRRSYVKKSFTLTLTEEEDEEFRGFFDATSQCSGATLHEIGQFVQRRKLWSKEKIRKFIAWFILEGLQEEWLIDEMGG